MIDIFNLDPIIHQVQENTAIGEGVKLGNKVRYKVLVTWPQLIVFYDLSRNCPLTPLLHYPMINFLFWNIRGISHTPNFRRLKRIIDEYSVQLVAICEPKVSPYDIRLICARLKMNSWLVNREGSIWVLYQNYFHCERVGQSPQYLILKLTSQLLSGPIYFSFVHAKCTEQERTLLCSALLDDNPTNDP